MISFFEFFVLIVGFGNVAFSAFLFYRLNFLARRVARELLTLRLQSFAALIPLAFSLLGKKSK